MRASFGLIVYRGLTLRDSPAQSFLCNRQPLPKEFLMPLSPLAGKLAPANILINVDQLGHDYYDKKPDPANPAQRVSFGTSGHRGCSSDATFNEAHILAITQAICEFRAGKGITGPLYIGMDTHASSAASQRTALEVLAANNVETVIQRDEGFTPTPVISHAILTHNKNRTSQFADGVVITPSHNPPRDGGFKYNSTNGGPADVEITNWVQDRANALLAVGNAGVRRMPYDRAVKAATTHLHDYVGPFVNDLPSIVDLAAIRKADFSIGVDPLGGASVAYWLAIKEIHKLNLDIVNSKVDPTFSFMTVDHDGKIRMDCSSPYAMASLVQLKDKYRVAFGNDPDSDRHGIVTPSVGLMNPNHYLAVAIEYLFANRPRWNAAAGVGKTLVSSSIIDRVAASLGKRLVEVPVGFKYFVDGLFSGTLGFGGEESAGASFLRLDGSVWSTDKDGIILNLLAAEITAVTGKDPGEHYRNIESRFGKSYYKRVDQPANLKERSILKKLSPSAVKDTTLAGEPIVAVLTNAPGNNAAIGGLKVTTQNGWFAARPSGTEDIYKIYAESLKSAQHVGQILQEAAVVVKGALAAAGN